MNHTSEAKNIINYLEQAYSQGHIAEWDYQRQRAWRKGSYWLGMQRCFTGDETIMKTDGSEAG